MTLNMANNRPEVTSHDVDQLWSDAITGQLTRRQTTQRAETFLDQVNAANPVVNWGLTTLRAACQSGTDADSLVAARTRWHADLSEYEADPTAWMRRYYRDLLTSYAMHTGLRQARMFGEKLVRDDVMSEADVAEALADHVE
jgi:hypothetical protein